MDPRTNRNSRTAPSSAAKTASYLRAAALAVIFVLSATLPAAAINRSWNAGNDFWSIPANWLPVGIPGGADVVYIGNFVGVENQPVHLDQDQVLAGLHIDQGMQLRTEDNLLYVPGDVTISGDNSSIVIMDATNALDAILIDVTVSDNSFLGIGGGKLRIGDQLTVGPDADLRGTGVVEFVDSGSTYVNNGSLLNGPGVKTLTQTGGGRFDLDGTTGNGHVNISGISEASLILEGVGLSDPFSGTLHLGHHAKLTMNLDEGWTADVSSEITVDSPNSTAELWGGPVTFAGSTSVISNNVNFQIAAHTVFEPTSDFHVGAGDLVELGASNTINGGAFTLRDGAKMRFIGATTVHGGTFNTEGIADVDGEFHFNNTTWDGNATINGRARQLGVATVTGPTVIDAELFDFGGILDTTAWNINSSLVINAMDTRGEGTDTYSGDMTISGGVFAKLTLNLAGGSQTAWTMSGELNLAGLNPLFVNRLAGAPVINFGETNISDSNVEVSADMVFMPGSYVNFAAAGSDLRMRGETNVRAGSNFNGEGTLHNGIGGQMYLHHGSNLDDVGLTNFGDLRIRRYNFPNQSGLAAVDRFTNDDDGTFHVRLGGYSLGEEHDLLAVTHAATLDGFLNVLLIDDGDGMFLPQVGDEFIILTALSGVTGQFLNDPISVVGAMNFHWTVLYHVNDVTLRLDSVTVPEPTSAALIALGAATASTLRRRPRRYCG